MKSVQKPKERYVYVTYTDEEVEYHVITDLTWNDDSVVLNYTKDEYVWIPTYLIKNLSVFNNPVEFEVEYEEQED